MKRFRVMAAALCAAVLLCGFSTTAYAGGGEDYMEGTGGYDPAEPVTEPEPEPNPFTPEGTGTVVDNATDEDGKEFFTITTPNENIFYLVIDRQRSGENVYFLNAVTEADLMALVEISKEPVAPTPEPEPVTDPEPEPEPEPEKQCRDAPFGAGRGIDRRRGWLVFQNLPPQTGKGRRARGGL